VFNFCRACGQTLTDKSKKYCNDCSYKRKQAALKKARVKQQERREIESLRTLARKIELKADKMLKEKP
jgi:hypothetical protein